MYSVVKIRGTYHGVNIYRPHTRVRISVGVFVCSVQQPVSFARSSSVVPLIMLETR